MLDSRPRGGRLEPHPCHYVVVLEEDKFSLVLVQPRKTRPCLTERLLIGSKESNQTNLNHGPARVILTLISYIAIKDLLLSYDVASGSEIMPCDKIDKPLVV